MAKPVSLLMSAACIAAIAIVGTAAAQAKQTCSVAAPAKGYWSWRMIDGRKCWYEGKPMLSKSMLEWPASAKAKAAPESPRELARVPEEKAGDPLDAQAYEPADSATFDALWRDRIEKR
jgi:hypothetical protein